MADKELSWNPAQGFRAGGTETGERVDVFISHCEEDAELAEQLSDLIQSTFRLETKCIRCVTAAGYGVEGGKPFQPELIREIKEAKVFIVLLTPRSMQSFWVAAEVGARLQTSQECIPLLAGLSKERLQSLPLASSQAIYWEDEAQLNDFIENLGKKLGKPIHGLGALTRRVRKLAAMLASAVPTITGAATMLEGEIGVDNKSESSWIDLTPPQDFYRGDRLRLFFAGASNSRRKPASKVLVRLLRYGENPGKAVGVLTQEGVLVPENRILEVEVPTNFNEVVQISAHGGERPWHYFLGKGNGPVTLTRVELLSAANNPS